ncbi:hypothetical protein AK812_SmicGene9087 [Symbiodinium microadriaticum]|uniref:Uncharacterized protein n=1 Tax=Symbiodinium microadriaticum TaxID=2951 RepID=A0A1Q9EJ76_SYMMI|nr:hypothetical protein AK812_SmicGene9087 [Symbiodinium microadriaticum]
MGRGGKSGQQPWQQGDRGYRVWPGAYSPQQYAAKDKRPWRSENTRAAPTFPSYASVTVPTDKPLATGSATDRAGGRTSSTTPAIQAALNQTRKAENRVIRLHDALAESGKLWEEYQAQMKEAFRLERLRFAKDKDKLAKAILEAEEAQEAARQNLRNVFAGSQGIAETGDVTMDGPDADQVFSEWLREEAGDDDAMIRRALAPASQTPNRGARPAQRTPTPGPGQAVMAPPGLAIAPTPPAMTDPYYNAMSPTMVPAGLYPHAYMGQAPMIPAGATGAFLQPHLAMMGATGPAEGLVPETAEGAAPPNPAPPSSGEPVAEGYGRSPTLQDRVARRKAMEPFGGSRQPPAVTDEGATTDTAGPATGPTRPGSVPIVEDDDEAHQVLTPDPDSSATQGDGRNSAWHDMVADLQPASRQEAREPEELPPPPSEAPGSSQDNTGQGYRARVEADIASKGASSCLQAQPGLCVVTPGVTVLARVTLCAPGHRLTTSEIHIDLPATIEHFMDRIYEAAPVPLDYCWNKLVPVMPQLGDGIATLIVTPHWFKQAGLAVVLIDARPVTGKVFAEVLPNQTCLEAIQRIVGPSVCSPYEVYVAGSLRPLQAGWEICVEEGDTMRVVPAGHVPLWGPSLEYSLLQPTPWLSLDPIPTTARALCVLLLQDSGKYLFSDFVQCDFQNMLRVTHFVGAEMSESRIVSAQGPIPYVYHGVPVRGIIAVVGRSTERDQQNRPLPAILFLDARPVGQDMNFCVLDRYRVSRDFLRGYVQCPPPPGHRLAVMGGQLRNDGYEFHSGEVLVLAFLPDDQVGPEDAESEPDGSDDPSQSQDGEPGSDDSTRSRSRHRDVSLSKASGDSSYQSHLPPPEGSGVGHVALQGYITSGPQTPVLLPSRLEICWKAISLLTGSIPRLEIQFEGTCIGVEWQAGNDSKPLEDRIGDAPDPQGTPNQQSRENGAHGLPDLRVPGDRSPRRGQPPPFQVEAPEVRDQPQRPAQVRALFVVLCEDYRPEVIPLSLGPPVNLGNTLREVQALRLPDTRRYFPRLLTVEPQPCADMAILLGIPGLPGPFCDVIFDCRAVGGYVFAGHADPEATKAELLAIAGFVGRVDITVWVPAVRGPLPDLHPSHLSSGDLVSLAPRGVLPLRLEPLVNMLRRPEIWDQRAVVPTAFDPGVWLLTDEGPCFHPLPAGAGRICRRVLAGTLRYDPERLFTVAPAPQIRNFCSLGVAASAVLVVTQQAAQPLDADPSPCIVILDLRPLQLGMTWAFASAGIFFFHLFAEDLDFPCREGFQLIAEGAPRVLSRPGVALRVVDGTRIVVSCAPSPRAATAGPGTSSSGSEYFDSGAPSNEEDDSETEDRPIDRPAGAPVGLPPPQPNEPHEGPLERRTVNGSVGPLCFPRLSIAALILLCTAPALASVVADPESNGLLADGKGPMSGSALLQTPSDLAIDVGAAVVICRLLCEPCCSTPSVQAALQALRTATRNLGAAWPLIPNNLAALFEVEAEAQEPQVAPSTTRVSFAVLTPDYPPELGEVDLELPCTPDEAIQAIQAARPTPSYVRFPFLVPASPQSIVGFAVVIATPRWAPSALTIMINTSAIDGRVFACNAPDYADFDTLVAMANLPPQADYHVFVGSDDQPIHEAAQIHLVAGIQVCITFADHAPPIGLPLARILFLPDAWGHEVTFPQVEIDFAYCVVHEGRRVLHIENYQHPFRFRVNLARRLGVDERGLRTLPARRAPGNISIDGVRCGFAFLRLFDSEPDVSGLHRIFASEAPQGWMPRFSTDHHPDGRPAFEHGLVVVVDYVPDPASIATPVEAPANATEGAQTQGGVATNTQDGSSLPAGTNDREQDDEGDAARSNQGRVESDQPGPSTAQNPELHGVFLVLAQDYTAELVEARMPVATQPAVALLYASRARASRDRERFPVLCAVDPQPLGSQAILLALPLWAPDGVVAAFDLTNVDGRLFALKIGNRATREGLLQAAELPNDPRFEVFVGNMPWPVPAATLVDVGQGDLIQVTFIGRLFYKGFLWLELGCTSDKMLPFGCECLSVVTCRGGYFDSPGFLNWIGARCPQGFRPHVWLGTQVVAYPGPAFPVQDGAVITAVYLPEGPPPTAPAQGPDDDGLGPPRDERPHGPDRPAGSTDDPAADFDGTGPDAGTGSSCSSSPADGRTCREQTRRGRLSLGETFLLSCAGLLACALAASPSAPWLFLVVAVAQTQLTEAVQVQLNSLGLGVGTRVDGQCAVHPGGNLRLDTVGLGQPPHCIRPIPTPVRAWVLPCETACPSGPAKVEGCLPCAQPLDGIQAFELVTLLEESRVSNQDYPLYLAATLLEAVIEHGQQIFAHPSAVTLSLELALPEDSITATLVQPTTPWPVEALLQGGVALHERLQLGGAALGFTAQQAAAFLQPLVRFGNFGDLLAISPPKLRRPLQGANLERPASSSLSCFVDGSFTPAAHERPALLGWSCVFVASDQSRISIVSGPGPEWYEQSDMQPSAFIAECIAMTAAAWIGSTAFFGQPITYFSDCQAAIQVASGTAASLVNDAALVLRRTVSCVEAFLGIPLVLCYVPGHQGYFGNEVADISAKLASQGHAVGHLLWTGRDSFNWWAHQASAVEWCGVAMRSLLGDQTLPPVYETAARTRTDCGLSACQMLSPFRPTLPAGAAQEQSGLLNLCFATYNVLSLCGQAFADRQPGGLAFAAGRPAMLAQCLDAAGIHAIAVQEARTETGFLRTSGYLRFCSGHEGGCLGVELWFREGHDVVSPHDRQSAGLPFKKEAFTTIHRDPRRLILFFSSGSLRLCFASLHAPHRGTEANQLHSWWTQTLVLLRKAAAQSPIVLGGDFNASVGSICCERVGDCGPEEEDDAGALLRELVSSCNAWIPATWDQCHSGQSWTYIQKRNQALTRPDMVCLPDCWREAQVTSWVDPSLHVGQPYIDHLATAVCVQARIKVGKGGNRQNLARIDAAALTDPANRPRLQQILSAAPKIPWHVTADAHAALLVG